MKHYSYELRNVVHPVQRWRHLSISDSIKINVLAGPPRRVNVFVYTGNVGGDRCRCRRPKKYFAFRQEDPPNIKCIPKCPHIAFLQYRLHGSRTMTHAFGGKFVPYIDLDIVASSRLFYTCVDQVVETVWGRKEEEGEKRRKKRVVPDNLMTKNTIVHVGLAELRYC